MTLNDLSSEQQEFVHLALSGKNVLCDACIGSGKTSTINVLCDAYPPERRILYLTYNRLLKLDAKDKIKNHNVLVQNYRGLHPGTRCRGGCPAFQIYPSRASSFSQRILAT